MADDPILQGISDSPDDYSELTKLPDEDNPRSDPDDVPKELDDTHQATDTNIDSGEEYDEGLSGAAEVADPNLRDSQEIVNSRGWSFEHVSRNQFFKRP